MEDRETARMRKYGESKTTRIMMAIVPHVTSGLGLRKFQADGFLLTRVYQRNLLPPSSQHKRGPTHPKNQGLSCVPFEVLATVLLRVQVFWDVTPYRRGSVSFLFRRTFLASSSGVSVVSCMIFEDEATTLFGDDGNHRHKISASGF